MRTLVAVEEVRAEAEAEAQDSHTEEANSEVVVSRGARPT